MSALQKYLERENTNQEAPALGLAHTHQVEFRGQAGEYFKIWIVNAALNTLTLGIYSPWAKVRTRQYLYGCTYAAGSNFRYHADPLSILLGRLLLLTVVGASMLVARILALPDLVWILGLGLMIPHFLLKGQVFHMRNTSYRGLRFGFDASSKNAYLTYGSAWLLTAFTGGIGAAVAHFLHTRFRLTHMRFGKTKFKFKDDSMAYLKIYWKAGMVSALPIVAALFLMMLGFLNVGLAVRSGVLFSPIAAALVGLLIGAAYVRARSANETARQLSLDSITFRSSMRARDMIWIYVVNAIAIVCTLGLATPWAMMRTMRYRAEKTELIAPAGALDSFIQANQTGRESSMGDAVADVIDLDLGI